MTEQSHVQTSFTQSKQATWVLGITAAILILVRESPVIETDGVIGLVGYGIGAGALASIFTWIARRFLKSRVHNDTQNLDWNIGIAAYILFFLLTWWLLAG
jgi:hypothetical protein